MGVISRAVKLTDMEELARKLDDIVGYGVVHDIFEAEETSAILMFTGQNAEAINKVELPRFREG